VNENAGAVVFFVDSSFCLPGAGVDQALDHVQVDVQKCRN
jgi:hypothetical protein